MFVTDRGLGRWSSAFQRPPISFHSRRAWSSFRNAFAGHSSWLYSYTAHEFVFTTSKRCGMRNNNSFKEGPGDTALKNKSLQSFPGVHVCGKIFHAQSNTAGVVLGCAFNWASEMGISFIFLSYWCSLGSAMFQFRANSSSFWSYWKFQGFPWSGSCFLSDYWRKKHGQALPGILQAKPKHKDIFISDFFKCLLKKLSLSALHKNEPGNQILI